MVAFDAVGPAGSPSAGVHGTTSPLTWTHVLGGSANAILVSVVNANSATNNITGVTVGGVSASLIGISVNPTSAQFTTWYGLLNPPTGSQTVSVSFSGTPSDMLAGSVSFTGAGGFGSLFGANNGGVSTDSQTVVVSSTTSGGMIALAGAFGGQTWSAFSCTGAGGTIRLSDPVSSTFAGDMQAIGTYASTGSSMTVGFSAGGSGSDAWSVAAVEVLPPSGPQNAIPHGGKYWRRNRKWRKRLAPTIDATPRQPYQIGSSTATSAATVAVPTYLGDALVAIFDGTTSSNITGVTDTKGNTWSRLHQYNTGSYDVEVWAVLNNPIPLAAGDVITPAFSSWASPRQLYLGVPNVNSEDFNAYVVTNGTSATPSSGASAALAQNGETVLGIVSNGNGGGPLVWDPGWNPFAFLQTGATEYLNVAWQVTPTTAPVTASGTITSATFTALVVAFGTGIPGQVFATTPEPNVTAAQPDPRWYYGPTPTITSRSSLQDTVAPSAATPEPVVANPQAAWDWFRTNSPIQVRSSLQDVPPAIQPEVVSSTPHPSWFATPDTTVVRNSLQDFATPVTPEPNVTDAQPALVWYEGNPAVVIRSTLQDPPVLTTPAPEVVTSQPDKAYFKGGAQVIQAPQAPVVTSGPTTEPTVVTAQPDQSWFRVQPPQDFRNTLQDIPAPGTDPVVVSAPVPSAFIKPTTPTIIRNPPAPVQPPTIAPRPVVVTTTQGPQFLVQRPIIVRNRPALVQTWRDPQHLGGTATDANHLGGTVTGNRFGGTVTGNRFGGTVVGNRLGGSGTVTHTLGGSATVQEPLGGSATRVSPFGGTLDEWTMQEIDINLGEFNDETLAVAITNNGSAYDLTGKSLQALFKTAAGVADGDPSTITLTSPSGGITITNAVGGLANVAIPKADLQNANITFWRLDVVSGGLQNTAIYGKVGITLL